MGTPDIEHGRVYFKQFGAERVKCKRIYITDQDTPRCIRPLQLKAVIVTNSVCFVYRMTEVDRNLINIGTNGKLFFEV